MELKNSPALTPPKSPPTSNSRNPTPPTPGSSPLPPLPPEVFLLMLHYVEPAQRYDLCRVSRSWYWFLTTEPVLWPTLHHVHLHHDQSWLLLTWIKRANYHAKQRGGINSLAIDLRNCRQERNAATPGGRTRDLCSLLEQSCVPVVQDSAGRRFNGVSTIRHLQLELEPDSQAAFEVLAILTRRARTAVFYHLATLDISTRLPSFVVHTHFLSIWPNVHSIKVTNAPYNYPPNQRPPRYEWSEIAAPKPNGRMQVCQNLQSIELVGVNVQQFYSTLMPVMTSLVLSGVTWTGRSFFYLLRIVRKSLVTLDCSDLTLEEIDGRETDDWSMHVMVTNPDLVDDHIFPDVDSQASEEYAEEPAPIIFPRLQRLFLSGEDTPPFFASLEFVESTQSSSLPTPIFVMPALLDAAFVEMPADLESFADDAEGALATFGRNAPNLLTLSLFNSNMSDLALFHCLAGLMGKLQVLNLCSTTITDKLIARLPALVPRLVELDVTGCDDISLQGVARCVETMADPDDEKRKLKVVKVDSPRYFDADYEAWSWLDWIGVLHRDEWDFTGLGPSEEMDGGNARRRWIVNGKLDSQKEERRLREERAEQMRIAMRKQEEELNARLVSQFGFQPGGASSASGGGSGVSSFSGSTGGSSMGRLLASTTNANSPATDANSVFPLDPTLASKDNPTTRGPQHYPTDIRAPQIPMHPLSAFPHVVPSSNGQHASIEEIAPELEYETDSEEEEEEEMEEVL